MTRPVFTREATGLVRKLGMLDAFVISIAIIGPSGGVIGMLFMPFYFPGSNAIIVFALGAVPAFFFAITYSIFTGLMPRSGGDYVWTGRTLGPRVASIFAILFLFSQIVSFISFNGWTFVSAFLSQFLFTLGLKTNSASLLAMSSTVTQPLWGYGIASVMLIFIILIGILGMDAYKTFNRYAFYFYAVAMLVFIGEVIALSNQTFQTAFNSSLQSYNLTYASVVSAATTNPSLTTFSLSSTILAFPLIGFLTYSGFNFNTYVAGETRDVSRSLSRAMFLSVLVTLIYLTTFAWAAYSAFGSSFLSGISYLYNTGALPTLPVEPTANFLLALALPAWLGAFVNISVGIVFFLVPLQSLIMFSRIVFAMSFDRILPVKLANVNDRFGSPHYAVLLVGIVSLIFESLYWLAGSGILSGFLNVSVAVNVAYIIPGFAALLFPFLKKDMYKSLESHLSGWLGWKIGGVPLLSIGGLAIILIWLFGIYTEFVPISAYTYLGSSIPYALVYTIVPAIAGLGIYETSKYYHMKKDGLDVSLAFTQVPPE
jgi:amino acid transporter